MKKNNQENKSIPELKDLDLIQTDRIIEMAWEDRTTFEAIEIQFGLKQQDVIKLMRKQLKPGSFKLWRERTKNRPTKHEALRGEGIDRFRSTLQKSITQNKISKR